MLVIGSPETSTVFRACRLPEEELGRPVNAVILSPEEWAERRSGILRAVARGHLVPVVGEASA